MESNTKKNKKGFFATLWESMTKTGGCCGSGDSCSSSQDLKKSQTQDEKKDEQSGSY